MVRDEGRRLLVRALAAAAAGLAATRAAALPATLRFAVSDSWVPPYILRREGEPVAGLMFDLIHAVAAAAHAQAVLVKLPSQRVDAALRDGEVDLHCLISPAWYGPEGPPGRLGPPMVVLEDLWVTREAGAAVDLQAQRGLRVGTVLGYRYDTLEAAFETGALQREDAPSPWHMLEKLRLGRSDAAVADRRVLQDYNRGRPAAEQLHARQRVARTQTYACLSPQSAWPQEALLRLLERVAASGAFKRVLGGA